MKHLKTFENVSTNDIDFNKIYIYDTIGYIAIGKIKPFEHRNIEPQKLYCLYDIFDNGYDETPKPRKNFANPIDFNNPHGDIKTIFNNTIVYNKSLTSKDLLHLREATPEETEKYYLSLSANKFNL